MPLCQSGSRPTWLTLLARSGPGAPSAQTITAYRKVLVTLGAASTKLGQDDALVLPPKRRCQPRGTQALCRRPSVAGDGEDLQRTRLFFDVSGHVTPGAVRSCDRQSLRSASLQRRPQLSQQNNRSN
ncbi:hypothetical protein FHX12_005021 [Rhizobium sp. BK609]|nr:hypothetical protein [Rhizobium sp. BK098]MBB3618009.1 hypothetical protein [Rhizobium sp. BK609]MBB3683539.1 hypothetical protein [Rhizobium sp. BK612]